MPAEIDGTKAMYAKTPAWHRIGTVNLDGWFTAEQALAVLNPTGELVRKSYRLIGTFTDAAGNEFQVEFTDSVGLADFDHETGLWRPLSVMAKDYGIVQREEQFRFVDEVIGQIDGAHYEAAVNLRRGKQTCLTAYLGDFILDEYGIGDKNKRFLWCFNSFDGSWAVRLKFGNFRVECANMAAMALRGSSDSNVIGSDWSTRHTMNVMDRINEAKHVLGLWKKYEVEYEVMAEHMIHTKLTDNAFVRIINGLFIVEKDGETKLDQEAANQAHVIYELSPAQQDVYGTVWGGLQSVIEYHDWATKVRGGKNTNVSERRFLRQVEDPTGFKQRAYDAFSDYATETKKVDKSRMSDIAKKVADAVGTTTAA